MSTLIIAVLSFFGFIVAYHTYGRWLARKIFRINPEAEVPSRELRDDVDYVPTKKEIIFGHHFTSIAGTGPIVGPAIAVFWGWLPALLWVVLGSIFIGAVHDFSALVVSLRNRGTDGWGHRRTDDYAASEVVVFGYLVHGTDGCFGYFRSGHCYHLCALPGIGAVGLDRDPACGWYRALDLSAGWEYSDPLDHRAGDYVHWDGRRRVPAPD